MWLQLVSLTSPLKHPITRVITNVSTGANKVVRSENPFAAWVCRLRVTEYRDLSRWKLISETTTCHLQWQGALPDKWLPFWVLGGSHAPSGDGLEQTRHPAGPNARLMDSSSLSPPHLSTSSLGLINPDPWLLASRSLPNLDSIRFHSWPHFACTHFHKWHWRRNMTGVYPQLPSYFLIPAPADATISWIIMLCRLGISLYSHQSAMAFDFPKQTTITP